MRHRLASSILISTAVGVSFVAAISSWAQAPTPQQAAVAPVGGSQNADTAKAKGRGRGPQTPPGPTPRLPDGKPDLTGMWSSPGPVGDIMQGMPNVPCDTPGAVPQAAGRGRGRGGAKAAPTCKEPIPYTAEGKKVKDAQLSKNDPEANCLPTGVPRMAPYPWRIVSDPTHIFFLFEGNIHSFRQIFMDGRKHKDDPDPTWYGDSIGSWDGDTLVVDTIGYNDKFWFDFAGNPHSEQLHTIERYTRLNSRQLKIDTTISDPVMYSKPFTISFTSNSQPGELTEYICQENQQDAQHLQGAAGLN